jgi:hypothetical protein
VTTEEKIKEFAELPNGWHYGGGGPGMAEAEGELKLAKAQALVVGSE